ncbi:MAG: creatininase family protein, partial [Tateyamaria sp.]
MTARNWADLRMPEFDTLAPARPLAVLPPAAIEQHGPHLPVGTDAL